MKQLLIATKAFRYRTRRLRAGDGFEAPRMEARVLKALDRAVDAPCAVQEASSPLPAPPPARNAFADLCAEYQALAGTAVDRRWGETRVRTEIEALRSAAKAQSADGGDEGSDGECLML